MRFAVQMSPDLRIAGRPIFTTLFQMEATKHFGRAGKALPGDGPTTRPA